MYTFVIIRESCWLKFKYDVLSEVECKGLKQFFFSKNNFTFLQFSVRQTFVNFEMEICKFLSVLVLEKLQDL